MKRNILHTTKELLKYIELLTRFVFGRVSFNNNIIISITIILVVIANKAGYWNIPNVIEEVLPNVEK